MKQCSWRTLWCAPFLLFMGLTSHAVAAPIVAEPVAIMQSVPEVIRRPEVSGTVDSALARISAQRDVSAFGFPCDQSLSTQSLAGALVALKLSAPCRPGQRVRVSQGDLHFDLTLPATGELSLTIPALSRETILSATFSDGSVMKATSIHNDLPEFARVALQSDVTGQMSLRARAPRRLPMEQYELGDGTGATLDVLSHHIDPEGPAGVIRLSLVSHIEPEGCDTARSGQIAELPVDGPPRRYAVELAAPGCDRLGKFLELKNVVPDLKLHAD